MSKEEGKNRRGEGKAKQKGNLFKRDTKRPNIFEEIIEYYFYFYVLFKVLFIIRKLLLCKFYICFINFMPFFRML